MTKFEEVYNKPIDSVTLKGVIDLYMQGVKDGMEAMAREYEHGSLHKPSEPQGTACFHMLAVAGYRYDATGLHSRSLVEMVEGVLRHVARLQGEVQTLRAAASPKGQVDRPT